MREELKKNQGEVMATSSKKQIEKAISKKERKADLVRHELSDLQLAVLEKIKRDCERVRPRWSPSGKLVCSLVMQGFSGKWSEQSFQFYFQDAATLEGMRLANFGQKGEFWFPLAKDVERVIKALLPPPPNGCLSGQSRKK